MDFKPDAQIDSGSVISGGGGGGRGGGIAVGGIGGIIVLILALFLGLNPGDLMGGDGGGGAEPTSTGTPMSECKTGADVEKNPACRWPAYMTSLNQFWPTQFKDNFKKPVMETFSGQIQTGCGTANSQVGPFYCPEDQQIYIDTVFAEKLLKQLGAKGGNGAEAYIIGHEYGHHVQNLTGVLQKAQSKETGPKSPGVRVELQADCYAGVWLKWAADNPDDIITNVTADDLARIVDAAKAVGDDHIQSQQGGVNPDAWTHGSSKARQYWVKKGFDSKDPGVCDTFATDELGD